MSFCWFTSFIGYPNFFEPTGRGAELAHVFISLGEAAEAGKSYADSKRLFPGLDHAQVETKKAAFQEFGLLYVVPRSNTLTLTPLGRQILDLCANKEQIEKNRRTILLSLARGLARYQFNNPLPVGGNRKEFRARARSSDVLPYLASYYLLNRLGGVLTESEFRGKLFGLQQMSKLRSVEDAIRKRRDTGKRFEDIAGLPKVKGTADNLKIYFLNHLSLDNEIIKLSKASEPYGGDEQIFELTQLGLEITGSVLDTEWNGWRKTASAIPRARSFSTIDDYFFDGVGQICSENIIKANTHRAEKLTKKSFRGLLDEEEIKSLKDLTGREYEEGHKRLVQHSRLETVRNPALVQDAKRAFKKKHGRYFCEACEFDFEAEYGKRGKDYIEAHHREPISELQEKVILRIEDLAMVCSNCHRMLHRHPWITVEELRLLIEQSV